MIELLVRATRALREVGMRRDLLGGAVSPRPVGADHDVSIVTDDGLPVGEYPDDPDAVPAWVLRSEAWHASFGRPFPTARTRRAYEAMVDRLRRDLEPQDTDDDLLPALSAQESAERFLGFLRANMDTDQDELILTSQEITDAYADWCRAESRHPSPDNFVRSALKDMSGVTHVQVRVPGPGRKRTWTFLIEREDTVSEVSAALRAAA